MRICEFCGKEFKILVTIDGKQRNLGSRKRCLDCSPFGEHRTSKNPKQKQVSYIWTIPLENFTNLIKNSVSRTEVLNKLEMRVSGSSVKILNKRIEKENLDISHFKVGGYFCKNRKFSNDELFIVRTDRNHPQMVRNRILKDKIFDYRCSECKIKKWKNKDIILELDHINGNRYDNRLENLRFLCPNCHSQTETFCGKYKKKKPIKICSCGNKINKFSKLDICGSCAKLKKQKYKKPTKEELKGDIWNYTKEELKIKYNCTFKTLKKWINEYGISSPERIYWILRKCGYSHEEALDYKKPIRKKINLLSEKEIIEIRKLINENKLSLREIGRIFNRSHACISEIKNNKIYINVGLT